MPGKPQIVLLLPSYVLNTDHRVSEFRPNLPAFQAVHAFVRVDPRLLVEPSMPTTHMSATGIALHDRGHAGRCSVVDGAIAAEITTVLQSDLASRSVVFSDHAYLLQWC